MKVVTAKEMARIEQLAYQSGASEEEFMHRAGAGVAEITQQCVARYRRKPKIGLLCGKGNNGGDAYVAGKILLEGGFHVTAFALFSLENVSRLNRLQAKRFTDIGGKIIFFHENQEINFFDTDFLIDGLLGTGFHGTLEGLMKEVIDRANQSKLPILAIDIPSGLNGTTGEGSQHAIQALETVFLGLPKSGCFLGDAWNCVGKVRVFDFGLPPEIKEKAQEEFTLIDEEMLQRSFPQLQRNRHKYEAGYVVGLGGSAGMPGAPILSSFAALRAGAGIVRLLHPIEMSAELAGAPYEIIREGYNDADVEQILKAFERAGSLFIGPGMGTGKSAEKILKKILADLDKPVVIDAEALTLIAKYALGIPRTCILTPHHGEMMRLLHQDEELEIEDLFVASQAFVKQFNCILILKGAPTFIFHPEGKPYVCPWGDPGMATAGSGDVLTGILAAFLAQKCSLLDAAILGVSMHAMAGERAAEMMSSYSLTAMDITNHLPSVFAHFQFKQAPFEHTLYTIR